MNGSDLDHPCHLDRPSLGQLSAGYLPIGTIQGLLSTGSCQSPQANLRLGLGLCRQSNFPTPAVREGQVPKPTFVGRRLEGVVRGGCGFKGRCLSGAVARPDRYPAATGQVRSVGMGPMAHPNVRIGATSTSGGPGHAETANFVARMAANRSIANVRIPSYGFRGIAARLSNQ